MHTHELLDRFELLYADEKPILADLRRANIDGDLSSIFRVVDAIAIQHENINDFRKAVNHLRKFVINKGEDVDAHIRLKNTFDVIGLFHQPVLLDTLWRVINSFPNANIKDAYSRGQILSKKWLIKEVENLPVDLGTVFLCAGWYGTLSLMLFEAGIKITKIRSFDIDDEVWPIAETINRPYVMNEWQFKAQTEDICKINYKDGHTYNTYRRDGQVRELYDKPDTVINTSCEHIENFRGWYDSIGKGTLVILQTNDYYEIEDHINCVDNIDQFKEMAPMTDCMYDGVLNLDTYNRFMLIGYR
jgi:hypothetical protein